MWVLLAFFLWVVFVVAAILFVYRDQINFHSGDSDVD